MVPILIIILPILLLALSALQNKTEDPDTTKVLQEMTVALRQMNKPI